LGIFKKITWPVRALYGFAKENLNPIGQIRDSISDIISTNDIPDHLKDENGEVDKFDPHEIFEANVIHFNLTEKDLVKKESVFYKTGIVNVSLLMCSSVLIAYCIYIKMWFALIMSICVSFIWFLIALHNFYRAWQIRERKLEGIRAFAFKPEYWFK